MRQPIEVRIGSNGVIHAESVSVTGESQISTLAQPRPTPGRVVIVCEGAVYSMSAINPSEEMLNPEWNKVSVKNDLPDMTLISVAYQRLAAPELAAELDNALSELKKLAQEKQDLIDALDYMRDAYTRITHTIADFYRDIAIATDHQWLEELGSDEDG